MSRQRLRNLQRHRQAGWRHRQPQDRQPPAGFYGGAGGCRCAGHGSFVEGDRRTARLRSIKGVERADGQRAHPALPASCARARMLLPASGLGWMGVRLGECLHDPRHRLRHLRHPTHRKSDRAARGPLPGPGIHRNRAGAGVRRTEASGPPPSPNGSRPRKPPPRRSGPDFGAGCSSPTSAW